MHKIIQKIKLACSVDKEEEEVAGIVLALFVLEIGLKVTPPCSSCS